MYFYISRTCLAYVQPILLRGPRVKLYGFNIFYGPKSTFWQVKRKLLSLCYLYLDIDPSLLLLATLLLAARIRAINFTFNQLFWACLLANTHHSYCHNQEIFKESSGSVIGRSFWTWHVG